MRAILGLVLTLSAISNAEAATAEQPNPPGDSSSTSASSTTDGLGQQDTIKIASDQNKEQATQQLLASKNALDRKLGHMFEASDNPFVLFPYEENYLLYTYDPDLTSNHYDYLDKEQVDKFDKHEVKFQFSIMFPLVRGIVGDNSVLAASYTQLSLWQAFNSKISSPFRETNYEPQLFLAWLTNYHFGGWTLRETEFGFNHQSNGRGIPRSRSWNRIYADITAVKGNWAISFKPWWRIPESRDNDDNPDITHYIGYYRVKAGYAYGKSTFTSEFHYNWNTSRGSVQVGWSHPILHHVRVYAQIFTGYGETLIDYNNSDTRFGLGIMLNDML
ncbi:phospholipase A [Celerinatantimonas sp. YJH-8]|uniref:phospholipase A n=1 Tax=Celerinatantimonas sp. YJH-8 TaxID=3228714 RepID=UPI0038C46932